MALIRHFPIAPNLNFVGKRMAMLAASGGVVLASLLLFAILNLNYGVDFRGGILIEVQTEGPADLSDMRGRLGSLGLGEVTLQEFGAPNEVLINVQRQAGEEVAQGAAVEMVKEALGASVKEYRRTEFVGPKVGDELKVAGALATVLAILGIALYVWFRFEWQFALAALVTLIHDVIAMIGFFALTQIEFNLATLAAVLTVAGYSINDTVVVFDRVREALRKYKKMPLLELLNMAVNQTLSRTILTSFTTLLALIALSVFGGAVIRGFSTSLIWGILIGTYSSFGLAVPLLSLMNLRRMGIGDEDKSEKLPSQAEAN
ncbi:MAG TPA: protein translocase subunit SecF [Kiloniellales bacterium]|jgi:preprotein translocase SecF subunit